MVKIMKLIAVAKKGKEFVHSTEWAYFAPDSSADRIAKSLNENKYMLNDGEKWQVYDYDYMQENYVIYRLSIYRNAIKKHYLF